VTSKAKRRPAADTDLRVEVSVEAPIERAF
jgi:hypothetical protein